MLHTYPFQPTCVVVWYLDSGCSKHMTENKEYLTDYVEIQRSSVTFADGVKNKVVSMGTLNLEEMPKLKKLNME